MISVVAPCLNEEKHLPTFLNSLVSQSFKDFEVVIVDGGSTDNSFKIMKCYLDKLNIRIFLDRTRNFGYIRNFGTLRAKGEIVLQCNCDNYLEPELLERLNCFYEDNLEVLSVCGRVIPLGTSVIAKIAYPLFDLLRFIFTCAPCPIKKYRPSGNFTSFRRKVWMGVGGYPEVTVNEDGLFGQKLDPYVLKNHRAVVFRLDLYVGHYCKKFEHMGGVKAFLFYLYTLTNFAPIMKRLLKPIEFHAGMVFQGEKPRRLGFSDLWEWL